MQVLMSFKVFHWLDAGPGMHDCYDGGDESSSSALSFSTVATGTANGMILIDM